MAERDEVARQRILTHHEELLEGVGQRAAAVVGAKTSAEALAAARAELVAYLTGEVLPHAAAEETTIYRASSDVGLVEQVQAMVAEHRILERQVATLGAADDADTCGRAAEQFSEQFARHVAVENDVLLPALLAAKDVSLADVLTEMADAFSAAKAAAARTGRPGRAVA